jgi:Protein of unknown function (DUF3833)
MKLILGVLIMSLFTACTTSIKDYASEKPALVLENYLNGKMTAHGLFMDRFGKVKKRFTVLLDSTWIDNVGTLKENFDWSDGRKTQRIWTITKTAEGKYTGTAADVDGFATGESSGNAFHWTYTMNLDVDGSIYKVSFDDWMYLINDKVLINKAVMSKFGIRLGEVLITFYKP